MVKQCCLTLAVHLDTIASELKTKILDLGKQLIGNEIISFLYLQAS